MNIHEITITFDIAWWNDGLKEYLESIDGIVDTNYEIDKNYIIIKYDANLTSIDIIRMELLLYLNIYKIPSIIAFDKHSNKKLEYYKLLIKDACCEYCIKGKIDDLMLVEGIDKVTTDYDGYEAYNVTFNIWYDKNIISEDKLKKIEEEFNN